jgi:predicted regulator of Ras-like GTPase activity (Roadblock/LC7/MglB family)
MTFEAALVGLQACPGVMGTAIADTDGIVVEAFGGFEGGVDEIVGEYSNFLREVASANRELQLGELEQLVVAGEKRTVLVTLITSLYFLLTVVSGEGNPGKARFVSRIAAHRLRHEFV